MDTELCQQDLAVDRARTLHTTFVAGFVDQADSKSTLIPRSSNPQHGTAADRMGVDLNKS